MAKEKTGTAQELTLEESGSRLEKIRERAYELFAERGCEHGHDLEDWMRAEKEISNAGAEKSVAKQ
jgi:hypothetical protein